MYTGLADPWLPDNPPETAVFTKNRRPHRPRNPGNPAAMMDDRIWNIIQSCWGQDPNDRPSAEAAAHAIRVAVRQSVGDLEDTL